MADLIPGITVTPEGPPPASPDAPAPTLAAPSGADVAEQPQKSSLPASLEDYLTADPSKRKSTAEAAASVVPAGAEQPAAPSEPPKPGELPRSLEDYLDTPHPGPAAADQQPQGEPESQGLWDRFKNWASGIYDPGKDAPKDESDLGGFSTIDGQPLSKEAAARWQAQGRAVSDHVPNVFERLYTARSLLDWNALRSFMNGVTFDWGTTAEAGIRSLATGEPYYPTRDKVRTEEEQWAKEHPETALAVHMGGGFYTPMVGAAKLAKLLPEGSVIAPAVTAGTVGAVGGGLTSAANTYKDPEESVGDYTERVAKNAAAGIVAGGVTGIVTGPISYQVFKGVQQAGRVLTFRDRVNAEEQLASDLARAGLGPEQLQDEMAIQPTGRERVITDPDDIADISRRMGAIKDARAAGNAPPETLQDIATEYGASVDTLRKRAKVEFSTAPQNVMDLANSAKPGGGLPVYKSARGFARVPGSQAQALAANAMEERNLGWNQRVVGLVKRYFGARDYNQAVTKLSNDINVRTKPLYDAADATDAANIASGDPDKLINFDDIIAQNTLEYGANRGPVDEVMNQALHAIGAQPMGGKQNLANWPAPQLQALKGKALANAPTPPLPQTPQVNVPPVAGTGPQAFPIRTLEQFYKGKKAVQALLNRYAPVYQGTQLTKGDPETYGALADLRDQMYAEVKAKNPEWWTAKEAAKDGFAAKRALAYGDAMANGRGDPVDHMKRYSAMNEDEQGLFRLAYGKALQNKVLRDTSETGNIVKLLRAPVYTNDGGIYQQLLGRDEANKFIAGLNRERSAAQSAQLMKGSDTAPDMATMNAQQQTAEMLASILHANPYRLLGPAWQKYVHGINKQNATNYIRAVTETDPENLRELLKRLGPLQQGLQRQHIRRMTYPTAAISDLLNTGIGSIISGNQTPAAAPASPAPMSFPEQPSAPQSRRLSPDDQRLRQILRQYEDQ